MLCLSLVPTRIVPKVSGLDILNNNIFYNQSAYRPGCSTESALQLLHDRIYSTSDEGRLVLLVSLDLSVAFDMVEHATLLKRLSCSFGVSELILGSDLT